MTFLLLSESAVPMAYPELGANKPTSAILLGIMWTAQRPQTVACQIVVLRARMGS
ncbi:Uncharacterised protein [Mycobacteroides abscessus subsp. massiliense]|nr:Uncharacterised protein [Mycobacteroides abscessus subsp. massiliense]